MEDKLVFYDLFCNLCKKKGISVTKATVEIGLSRTIGTKWKNTGATPNGETLNKIANYFDVPVGYLLGNDEPEKPVLINKFTFYEHFISLCHAKKVSPSRATTEAGINKSAVTYWKNNPDSKPTGQIALKLCDYFGISMADLYGEEPKKPIPINEDELDEDDNNLLQYAKKLTPTQKKFLIAQIQLMLEQQWE